MEEPFDEEEIQRLVKDLDEAGTRAFHELYCFSNMVFSRTQLASTVLVCPINTLYAWNAELGCLTIHIVVDIFRHDEITISCNDDLSYENWSKVLLKGYRFRCQCEVCQTRTPRGDASVTRRKRMGEINDAMVEAETTRAEVKSPPTDKGCLAKGLEMFGLHLHEDMCHPQLAHAYHRISQWSHAESKRSSLENQQGRRTMAVDHATRARKKALKYGRKELELDIVCDVEVESVV